MDTVREYMRQMSGMAAAEYERDCTDAVLRARFRAHLILVDGLAGTATVPMPGNICPCSHHYTDHPGATSWRVRRRKKWGPVSCERVR
jgi:hypothetical protein